MKGLTKPTSKPTVTTHSTRETGSKGETTMTMTEKSATPAKSTAKNGVEAKPEIVETKAPETQEDDGPTKQNKGGKGAVPTMPGAIVYKQGGKVFAVVHHPVDGTTYMQSGKGEGSATGALVDSGYRLSPLSLDAPEWLIAKLPQDATLIGYATLRGFPLIPQD